MLNTTRVVSLNGTSSIDGNPVANMTASITGNDFNESKSIYNFNLYKEHKDEVEADIAEFKALADKLLAEME